MVIALLLLYVKLKSFPIFESLMSKLNKHKKIIIDNALIVSDR